MKNVKYVMLPLFFLFFCTSGNAQFLKKLGKAAERAAERTVENRVEKETAEKTDQVLDSILEPGSGGGTSSPVPSSGGNTTQIPSDNTGTTSENNSPVAATSGPKTLSVYSKFDFVPGDKQLFFDDFSNDFIGDFPSKWNTDGGGEIVTLGDSGTKWLELKMSSFYIPDVGQLPENYTVEFDIATVGTDTKTSSAAKLHIILDDSEKFGYGKNTVYAYLPFCQYVAAGTRIWGQIDGKKVVDNTIPTDLRTVIKATPHVSIAVNKERFRLWVNEKKYVDIPRIVAHEKINTLKFEPVGFRDGKERLFITNVKVAEGGVDLRRKLISEGKVSTNGILFDSGSDNLKAESMGIIRQISQVLLQEKGMNLKIVGHTDADGTDEANLTLSKKRAEAVKKTLVNIYSIDAGRLSSEGKGETEPLGDNSTTEGKAQNRRVEFIKQ